MSTRTGRPKSESPKKYEVKDRIDEKTNEDLERYCLERHTTKTEVVRAGVKKILYNEKE